MPEILTNIISDLNASVPSSRSILFIVLVLIENFINYCIVVIRIHFHSYISVTDESTVSVYYAWYVYFSMILIVVSNA